METKQDLINLLKEKEKEREELRRILQSYLYKDMDIDTMPSSEILEFSWNEELVDRDNFLIHWKDYAFIRATIQSYKQALEVIENIESQQDGIGRLTTKRDSSHTKTAIPADKQELGSDSPIEAPESKGSPVQTLIQQAVKNREKEILNLIENLFANGELLREDIYDELKKQLSEK